MSRSKAKVPAAMSKARTSPLLRTWGNSRCAASGKLRLMPDATSVMSEPRMNVPR